MKQNEFLDPSSGVTRRAITMDCHGSTLVGIVDRPRAPGQLGVVVLVGGPQYRAGSHRQFVSLAQDLAAGGITVLRFDHRGIGDSEGEPRPFYTLNDDLRTAVNGLMEADPEIEQVVIWGLCDAAAAALLYANTDQRIAGMVLLNPWLNSPQAQARSLLTHYYRRRLASSAFWKRLLFGEVKIRETWREVRDSLYMVIAGGARDNASLDDAEPLLAEELAGELAAFHGSVLVVLSGEDLTAATFRNTAKQSQAWKAALAADSITLCELPDADHTFSKPEWTSEVSQQTLQWVQQLMAVSPPSKGR